MLLVVTRHGWRILVGVAALPILFAHVYVRACGFLHNERVTFERLVDCWRAPGSLPTSTSYEFFAGFALHDFVLLILVLLWCHRRPALDWPRHWASIPATALYALTMGVFVPLHVIAFKFGILAVILLGVVEACIGTSGFRATTAALTSLLIAGLWARVVWFVLQLAILLSVAPADGELFDYGFPAGLGALFLLGAMRARDLECRATGTDSTRRASIRSPEQ